MHMSKLCQLTDDRHKCVAAEALPWVGSKVDSTSRRQVKRGLLITSCYSRTVAMP